MDAHIHRELHELLSGLLDGRFSPEQEERLGELLSRHEEARELYRAYFDLHADLALPAQSRLAAETLLAEVAADPPKQRSRGVAWWSWLAVAAAVLVAMGSLLWRPAGLPAPVLQPHIASVEQAEDAEWTDDSLPLVAGDRLAGGTLHLLSGTAELKMNSGAQLVLAAPVRLELIDAKAIRIHGGNVTVNVPEAAIGFRVITPTADVVDLGTEFSIGVEEDGATEVHVRRGVVVARGSAGEGVIPILAKEAGRIDIHQGDLVSIDFDAERFLARKAPQRPSPRQGDPAYAPLPEGARLVFLGDRATDRETHLLLINQTLAAAASGKNYHLFNAGVAFPLKFDEASFDQYVASLRPTHAVIEFGPEIAVNSDRWPWSKQDFREAIERLCDRLEQEGIEPILEVGFPVHAKVARERLAGYNEAMREIAAKRNYRLADVEARFRAAGKHDLLARNGWRPTFMGHREMAIAVLEALGFPQAKVQKTLELALLPGVVTDWQLHFKDSPAALTAEDVAALAPDESWESLFLPQPEDKFAKRLADATHSITYRDRVRGFATNLHHQDEYGFMAVSYVDATAPREMTLNTGATLQSVWVNGEKVFDSNRWTGWHAGKQRIPVQLRAGRNTIVIEGGSSFFVSLTEQHDWPLPVPSRQP